MAISRRDFLGFLKIACALAALPVSGLARRADRTIASLTAEAPAPSSAEVFVNDIHSQLNRTRVSAVYAPNTVQDLRAIIWTAKRGRAPVSICGRRHSMGGQQFGTDNMFPQEVFQSGWYRHYKKMFEASGQNPQSMRRKHPDAAINSGA